MMPCDSTHLLASGRVVKRERYKPVTYTREYVPRHEDDLTEHTHDRRAAESVGDWNGNAQHSLVSDARHTIFVETRATRQRLARRAKRH